MRRSEFATRIAVAVSGTLALFAATPTLGQISAPDLDVPYVPTPMPVVDAMLELGQVGPKDTLYDLGSGDGRIVIRAAERFGTRGTGIDLNPIRIQEARAGAREANVEDKTRFMQSDIFETDFSDADVLTMYLLPNVNMELRPRILKELEPGTRVVSHAFDMEDWQPDRQRQVGGATIYLWIVPADVSGDWGWTVDNNGARHEYQVSLDQHFQEVSGRALVDGHPATLDDVSLEGDRLRFRITPTNGAPPMRFEAVAADGRLQGVAGRADAPRGQQVEWSAAPTGSRQG